MVIKEDFGNLGNLVAYLNGEASLEERIKKINKIFFIPLRVPPQHKEEVVILWLADILTSNKVLTFSKEEVHLIWSSLRTFLCSKRLKALCSNQWVCPFTLVFIQTLMTTVSETSDPIIKEEAVLICEYLYKNPTISPQSIQLSSHSLNLCPPILTWLNPKNVSSSHCNFLTLLFQKAVDLLTNNKSLNNAMAMTYDKLLLPSLQLSLSLQNNGSSEVKELLEEMKTLLVSVLFSKDLVKLYDQLFRLPMEKESKQYLPHEGECLFGFLIKCISSSDKEVAAYVLREYSMYLFKSYKEHSTICFRFLVNIIYLFGISLEKGPSIEVNSIAAQTLSQIQLVKITRDKFIAAVLEALVESKVSLNHSLASSTVKDWIKNLGRYLLQEKNSSEYSLKCIIIIMKMNPMWVTNNKTIFADILKCNRTTDADYLMLDNAMCEILDVYVKLRQVDKMYETLSKTLFTLDTCKGNNDMSQEAWLAYEKKPFLPPTFMQRFLSSVKEIGTQMWLNLWSSITEILSKSCHRALQNKEDMPGVTLTIWLSSCALSATSVLEAVSVSGMAVQVADMMNVLAGTCVKVLVEDMFALDEGDRSLVCRSLLNFILVWNEIHIKLMTTETGYVEATKFPLKECWESSGATDLGALVSFLDRETLSKMMTECIKQEDDASKFAVMQLVIQKISYLQLQRHQNKARGIAFPDDKAATQLQECVDYVLLMDDAERFPSSTSLVALHLPAFMPLVRKGHLEAVARMFVDGIEEEREPWIKFGTSCFFHEFRRLHSPISSVLCHDMLSLLAGSKTRLSDQEMVEIGKKNKPKYLSQKMFISLIKLQDMNKGAVASSTDSCLRLVNDLMTKVEGRNARLTKLSEKKILSLLKVLAMFPLPHANCQQLLVTVVLFVLTLLIEEGGLNGRTNVVCSLLSLLNETTFNPLSKKVFKHTQQILLWFVKDSESLLQNFVIEETHLRIITEMEEPSCTPNSHSNPLGELLHLLTSLTQVFLSRDVGGKNILSYAEALSEAVKDSDQDVDMYLVAAMMLGIHLRKKLKTGWNKNTSNFMDALQTLSKMCLPVSQENIDLSRVTRVSLSNSLSVFTTLLVARKTLRVIPAVNAKKEEEGRGVKRKLKEDCEGEEEEVEKMEVDTEEGASKSFTQPLNIDWTALLAHGTRLADLASDNESAQLKKLGLEFFFSVADSLSSLSSSTVARNAIQKVWSIISFPEDFSESQDIKSLLKDLSLPDYKLMLRVLLKDTWKDPLKSRTLFQWYAIVTSEPGTEKGVRAKSAALEQFISIVCIQIANQSLGADQVGTLVKLLKIFSAVFECKNVLSVHSKSMVLNACGKFEVQDLSTSDFVQVCQESVKVLHLMLMKEEHLIADRPTSVMSAITSLATALMDQADEQKDLPFSTIKELESCGRELEKVVKGTKAYEIHFFKIAPFSLGKIVAKMQQTALYPTVKESIERVVYGLLDYSDSYSMCHLMVTLPPSVTTLLKHLHTTYTQNFKFDPNRSR